MKSHNIYSLLLLVLSCTLFIILRASATHIGLRTSPGSVFSIPLEFGPSTLSPDAPKWVAYGSGGNLMGVGGPPGFYNFSLKEEKGLGHAIIEIKVKERVKGAKDCEETKKFWRILNLKEKLEFGDPGSYFTEDNLGTVLHYSVPCSNRKNRAADDDSFADDEGSGGEDDEDDLENEDEDNYDVDKPEIPILPTPSSSLEIKTVRPSVRVLEEFIVPRSVSLQPSNTIYSLPTSSETPLLSSSDWPMANEYGSGDFEITPSTPVLSYPSSTPTLELTPTLPPEQPVLRKQIEKQSLNAGKVFKFSIADAGFFSSPHVLSYSLGPASGEALPDWVALEDGKLVAWPMVSDVSDHKLTLLVEDTVTSGVTPYEILLSVRQPQKSRVYNHEFELSFIQNISAPKTLLYHLFNKVQEFGGGGKEDDFVGVSIDKSSPTWILRWTNESVLVGENQFRCPKEDLKEIYSKFSNGSGSSSPSKTLIKKLAPHFIPQSVGIHLIEASHCGNVKVSEITGQKLTPEPILPPKNLGPYVRNQIDVLYGTVGEFLIHKVDENFCYDPEDGGTGGLKLELMDKNGGKVGVDNWLQFDEKNQEFYGLPSPGTHVEEYTLKCSDSLGKFANDALEVKITHPPPADYSTEFRAHFQSASPFSPLEIRKFMETLSRGLNESLSNIIVISHQTSGSSVQFLWNLRSNPSSEAELTGIRRLMLGDDGRPKGGFRDLFRPDFNLTFGQIVPKGRIQTSGTSTGGEREREEKGRDVILFSDDGTYLVTYIIPSALIAIMVLLAILIACILSRRQKAIPSSSEEVRAFIKKGVPVIFQDELEEDKGARSRSPAILREEHPPLPPEYRRSPIEQYQPPPPMSKGGAGRGVRPGTHYRRPPPYLPP